MFAGIGGFRAGLDRVGGFQCIGHCEIDQYADASYRAIHNIRKDECYFPDARTINPQFLPNFDLLCAGFPCQSFSISGKKRGFADPRGTLFFEVARLVKAKRPAYFWLENVSNLLSHDKGRTFTTILSTLSDLGYGMEWAVLNSSDFGVPQFRRRVFLIGYLDARCAGKLLPVFGTTGKTLIPIIKGSQSSRVYDPQGVACTQTYGSGGMAGKTGLYFMEEKPDSLSSLQSNENTVLVDLYAGYPIATSVARGYIADDENKKICHQKTKTPGVLLIKKSTKYGHKVVKLDDSINLCFTEHNDKHGYAGKQIVHTLDISQQDTVLRRGRVRRLLPRECLRLQGFAEDQIDRLLAITSDSQAYQQAGNSVTVPVIEAIGRRLRKVHEEINEGCSR